MTDEIMNGMKDADIECDEDGKECVRRTLMDEVEEKYYCNTGEEEEVPPMADKAQEKMDDEKEFAITRIVVDTTTKGDDGASQ